VVRIRVSARYSSLFLVDLFLDSFDQRVRHEAIDPAERFLIRVSVGAKHASADKLGNDLTGRLVLSLCQLLRRLQDVLINVERGAHASDAIASDAVMQGDLA
jgi:hypothetical protein